MRHQAAWQGSRCRTAAQPPALKPRRTALVPMPAAAPDDAAAAAAGAAAKRRPSQSKQPVSSDDGPPSSSQQQQEQQQPRIVLTPLSNPPASAAGSIVRSSQLGSWSAMGPPTSTPAYVSSTKQQQQQHQQRRHKGTAQQHAGEAGQHKHGQQQPSPAGKQQTQQQRQKQQQHRRTKPAAQDSKDLASRARQMTTWLGRSGSISSLWDTLQECRGSPALNIVHVATAYKTCADLFAKQPRQQQAQQLAAQQQRQQLRPHGAAEADAAVVPPEGPLDKTLLLLDQLTALQLSVAAAAVSARLSGSSGSSSSVTVRGDDWNARSLSSIVSSNARMRRKLPGQVLLLILEAFLMVAGEAQPLLPATTTRPRGEPQDQQQQQHQWGQHSSSGTGTSSTSVSGSSSGGAAEPGSPAAPATSNGSSTAVSDAQSTCHALSLLVWGVSKLGFTATTQELSSARQDSGNQQQQQLEQQQLEQQQQQQQLEQQYLVRLAAVGARVASAGSPRDVSTLCYGFASAGYKDAALWGRLGAAATSHMNGFTPQEFMQTLWAFATVGTAPMPMVQQACAVAGQLAGGLNPQGLATVLWALTTLLPGGTVPPATLDALQDACLRVGVERFRSVDMTVLVGGLTRQGSIRGELAVGINRAIEASLLTYSAENLCKVLSGLACLNALQQPLMAATEPLLLRALRSGTVDVQQACHGVWGVAITDQATGLTLLPPLLQLASKHVHIVTRSSDATAKLCSVMAMTCYRNDAFLDRLAHCLLTGQTDAAPAAAAAAAAGGGGGGGATAAAAAAAAGGGGGGGDGARLGGGAGGSSVKASALQQSAGGPAQASDARGSAADPATAGGQGVGRGSPMARWRRASTPHHLVSIAGMLAKLGLRQHTPLLQALIQHFLDLTAAAAAAAAKAEVRTDDAAPSVGSRDARSSASRRWQEAMLLWCIAVLDMRHPAHLTRALLLRLQGAPKLSTAAMAQVVQVHMWLQTLGSDGTALAALLPGPLLQEALAVWRHRLVPLVVFSQLHSQVLGQLAAMQLPLVSEAVTPDGMFSVDILVQYKGCAVALEVLGPEHYTSNKLPVVPGGVSSSSSSGGSSSSGSSSGSSSSSSSSSLQQQEQQQQHVLLGPDLLRFRLLAARNLALAAVSSFEASGAVSTAGGARALRQLLGHKLEEAVQLHLQYRAANTQLLSEAKTPPPGTAGGRRRARRQQQQQQQSLGPELSRLMTQAGFSDRQQQQRRSWAQRQQQRQQARDSAQTHASRQQAMQTLLTAAGEAGAGEGGGAAAGAGDDVLDAAAGLMSSAEEVFASTAAVFDSEFDLPLDLEEFA